MKNNRREFLKLSGIAGLGLAGVGIIGCKGLSANKYSRIHKISGTKAVALKYPLPEKISVGDNRITSEEYKILEEKYTPEITKRVGETAKKVGGHGGMDFIMDWRLIDSLRNALPLDMTVYDAALWSAIGPLSEWSVAHRSFGRCTGLHSRCMENQQTRNGYFTSRRGYHKYDLI